MRFQFVDRIDEIQKFKHARATKTVSFEEGFLRGLEQNSGCMPRTLMIECAAQLASWLVLYSTDFARIPMVAKIEEAHVEESVPCGTAMTLEVDVISWNEEGVLFDSRISLRQRAIASGMRCLCTFVDSVSLVDPSEMRIRFRELAKGARIE